VTLVGVGPGREQTIWTDAGLQTLVASNGWPIPDRAPTSA
jgi:hypothetical protein